MADYTVVLKSIAKGKYIQVAEALKSILGLQEQVVGRIVSSLPIALFDRLKEGQARAIAQAMAPAEEAGAAVEVAPRAGSNCARMSWPTLPKIAGRDIESFASAEPSESSAALRCPVCGAELVLKPAGAPAHAPAPAAAQPSSVIESGPAFDVTGEDDLEMLGEVEIGTRAPDVPQVPAAAKTPTNLGSAAKPSTQAGVPMDLEDFEAAFADQAEEELGRDGVLQELGQVQGKPVAGTQAGSPPPQPKTPPGPPPTGTRALPPSAKPKAPSRTPARPTKAAGSRAPARARPPKSRRRAGSGSMPSAGAGSYSVFAAKSSSPRFLELVAEVRGISPQQAKQLAKRQIIQLARDVDQKQAEAIRDRFLAERFQAQVHSSKGG